MFILLVWTHEGKHLRYWIYFLFVFLIGMIVEIIGTHTGMLFGTYAYTNVLGVKCFGVPLLIGLNWFVTLTTCSITINTLWDAMLKRVGITLPEILSHKSLSLVIDSAFLAVAFDATIEPVAKKLDFWQWKGGEIPFYNYVCWFLISLPLLYIYNKIGFSKKNEFAPHLLIIQTLFFITLNMFL